MSSANAIAAVESEKTLPVGRDAATNKYRRYGQDQRQQNHHHRHYQAA